MKYFVVISMAMLVAVCTAQPTSDLETGITNNERIGESLVESMLEEQRENIPDPLETDEWDIDLAVLNLPGTLEGHLNVSQINIIGLSTFEATNINILLTRLTIALQISELVISFGNFEFNGAINGDDVYAKGTSGKLTLYNVVVSGNLHIRIIGRISISDPDLELNVESVNSEIVPTTVSGIGDQDFNDFVATAIPTIIDENKEQISEMINALVESALNN